MLIHSSIFRHLGCFQFLSVINNVTVKACLDQWLLKLSLGGHFLRSKFLKMNSLGKRHEHFVTCCQIAFTERLKGFYSITNNTFPWSHIRIALLIFLFTFASLLDIQWHQSWFEVLWNNNLNTLRSSLVGVCKSCP